MRKALDHYRRICELAEADPEYRTIETELKSMHNALRELLNRLSDPDKDLITQYIGHCGALELRMLEISCFHMDFRDST